MQFEAQSWKDDPNNWSVYYLLGVASGVQPTIDGKYVNLGSLAIAAWSGIRGLGRMTPNEAKAVATQANRLTLVRVDEGSDECCVLLDEERSVIGAYQGGFPR